MEIDASVLPIYVDDFLVSDATMRMSAEEIGQYLLLLFHSWRVKKDASLPDDLELFNTIARGKVTDKVLELFPVVETEWGPRRRNKTLYHKWQKHVQDQEMRSERARMGGLARQNSLSSTEAVLKLNGSCTKGFSDSEKGVSNLSNSNSDVRVRRAISIAAPESDLLSAEERQKLEFPDGLAGKKAFSSAATIWRNIRNTKLANLGGRKQEWENYVEQYGSAHVLAAFDLWARELNADFKPWYPVTEFFKEMEEYLNAIATNLRQPVRKTDETAPLIHARQEQESNRLAELAAAEIAAKKAEYETSLQTADMI